MVVFVSSPGKGGLGAGGFGITVRAQAGALGRPPARAGLAERAGWGCGTRRGAPGGVWQDGLELKEGAWGWRWGDACPEHWELPAGSYVCGCVGSFHGGRVRAEALAAPAVLRGERGPSLRRPQQRQWQRLGSEDRAEPARPPPQARAPQAGTCPPPFSAAPSVGFTAASSGQTLRWPMSWSISMGMGHWRGQGWAGASSLAVWTVGLASVWGSPSRPLPRCLLSRSISGMLGRGGERACLYPPPPPFPACTPSPPPFPDCTPAPPSLLTAFTPAAPTLTFPLCPPPHPLPPPMQARVTCSPTRWLWKDVAIPWGDPRSYTFLWDCALVLARPPGVLPSVLAAVCVASPSRLSEPPCPSVTWTHVWALPGARAAVGLPRGLSSSAPAWAKTEPRSRGDGWCPGVCAAASGTGLPVSSLPGPRTGSLRPTGGRGTGTRVHTHPSLVRHSEPSCPTPPSRENCALELQSDCLAQQPHAREMEQKAS